MSKTGLASLEAMLGIKPAKRPRPDRYKMITHNGETRSEHAWAAKYGMRKDTLRKRLARGMSMKEALETPLRPYDQDGIKIPKEELRQLLLAFKSRPCSDCGGTWPYYVMDCDHVRGDKGFDISSSKDYTREAVMMELEKCEVVCANCHRIRTHKRLNPPIVS